MSDYYSNAETRSQRSTFESNGLIRYLNSPQPDRGSSTAFVFAPSRYHRLDEAATWAEFESKIRSVGYHLGKYVEHRDCNKHSKGVVPEHAQGELRLLSPNWLCYHPNRGCELMEKK